jgi:hypothetical protein
VTETPLSLFSSLLIVSGFFINSDMLKKAHKTGPTVSLLKILKTWSPKLCKNSIIQCFHSQNFENFAYLLPLFPSEVLFS